MTASTRDEFSEATKRLVASRVNKKCSRPECRAQTSGPHTDSAKALNIGVAAHITAAAPSGPRYDATLSSEQRRDSSNAIWLCQNCAKLIDNDSCQFTAEQLRSWKGAAEQEALTVIGKNQPSVASLPTTSDKWVTLAYAEKTGIAQNLKAQGYVVRWTANRYENERIELEGWEHVVIAQTDGTTARLKVLNQSLGGYLVLLKKIAS